MHLILAGLSLATALGASAPLSRDAQMLAVSGDSAQVARSASTGITGVPRRSSARVGVGLESEGATIGQETPDTATAQRRRAVEHSDWYYRRLTLHKVASFTTIPLVAAEWYLGDKLYKNKGTTSTRSAHQAVAGGLGVLFGVNTITGVWNLWDSRNDSQGRARRMTHSALMLASDAGYLVAAAIAPGGEESGFQFEGDSNNRSRHRAVAIGSMGVSVASYLMMYLWK